MLISSNNLPIVIRTKTFLFPLHGKRLMLRATWMKKILYITIGPGTESGNKQSVR